MGYRKLTVDDQVFEYTIGSKFVKFRGGPAIPVENIGFPVNGNPPTCYMITPGRLREFIVDGKVDNSPRQCTESTYPDGWAGERVQCPNMVPVNLRALPYQAEIEGKLIYVHMCETCLDENAQDI